MKLMQLTTSRRWSGLVVLISSLVFVPTLSRAQNIAITHCNGSCPAYQSKLAANRADVVVHNLYAAGLNGESGLPDWVAYRLSKEAIGVASLLPRSWQPDSLLDRITSLEIEELASQDSALPDISTSSSPYGQSTPVVRRDERVRLTPMSSFANTPYWNELNNLSNMLPMPAPLRLGAWLRLEQSLNELVSRRGDLYVVTGPMYLITQALSSTNSRASFDPAAYFKVVVAETGVASFVFAENLPQHAHHCDQLGELGEIEAISDLEFFPERDLSESSDLIADLGCDRRNKNN